ncbi:hypothetical protein PQR71_06025 [Paraburkholderia fungorum]|uniref:hypothetical protein n=1 Tax=Paraburkholderia fungorum TaxID=134537 RepID=UPI0038BD3940
MEVRTHHGDANYNPGLLVMRRGRSDAALPHPEAALRANPDQRQYGASHSAGRMMLEMSQPPGQKGSAPDALVHLMAQTVAEAPAVPVNI